MVQEKKLNLKRLNKNIGANQPLFVIYLKRITASPASGFIYRESVHIFFDNYSRLWEN